MNRLCMRKDHSPSKSVNYTYLLTELFVACWKAVETNADPATFVAALKRQILHEFSLETTMLVNTKT